MFPLEPEEFPIQFENVYEIIYFALSQFVVPETANTGDDCDEFFNVVD